MFTARVISVLLLAAVSNPQATQRHHPQLKPWLQRNLAIQLEPGVHSSNDLPSTFTVVFLNLTDGDLRIPYPAINCTDPNLGSLYLDVSRSANVPIHLHDCKVDRIDSAVEERIPDWHLLHGGESMRVENIPLPKEEQKYARGGSYFFVATYTAPELGANTRETMYHQKVLLPVTDLRTDVMQLMKEPKK